MAAKKKVRTTKRPSASAKKARKVSRSQVAPAEVWDEVPEDDPETIFHLKEAARHFDAAFNISRKPRRRR